ncbi:hypothetical protein GH733_012799 [Mirounga leonina]|nr:hypothetical protein GH733_012799 [Mirounga leonina]
MGFCSMSVLWTCGGVTALTGRRSLPGLSTRRSDLGCAGAGVSAPPESHPPPPSLSTLLSRVSVGAGGRCCPAGAGGSDATPCSPAVRTQAEPLDAVSGRSCCALPLPGPLGVSVLLVCAGLFAVVAWPCGRVFPWVGLLWKVWEALLTPRPRFLPGCSLGLHVTWSCEPAPSPGCGRWFFQLPHVPRPRAGLLGPHSSTSSPLRPPSTFLQAPLAAWGSFLDL